MPNLKKKPFNNIVEGFSWFIAIPFYSVHFSNHNLLNALKPLMVKGTVTTVVSAIKELRLVKGLFPHLRRT